MEKTTMTRAFTITLLLLIAAIAFIIWRETSRFDVVSGPEHRALIASIEAENAAAMQALAEAQAAELESLKAELAGAVAEAERERLNLSAQLYQKRQAAVAVAASGPEQLKQAVIEASGAPEADIKVDAASVSLTHSAALRWVDLTLSLHNDLLLCDSACAVRLARQKQEIVPPLTVARQAAQTDSLRLSGRIRLLEAENEHLERQMKAGKAREIWIGVGSALAGLAIGGGGMAVYSYTR
jgi:hypothetical protein